MQGKYRVLKFDFGDILLGNDYQANFRGAVLKGIEDFLKGIPAMGSPQPSIRIERMILRQYFVISVLLLFLMLMSQIFISLLMNMTNLSRAQLLKITNL